MKSINKQAIIETIKEGLRIAVLAAITALIGYGTEQLAGLDPNSTFYVVGTIVLRLADKLVHKSDNNLKGLLPF